MEKVNTRQEILDTALSLFSTQGYEATSVSQIAEAVGIRKASLYSHFSSKQDILDELMQSVLLQYDKHSIFANADWDDPEFTKDKQDITYDRMVQIIVGQMHYIIHDPTVYRARKMLTIEQFQNPQISLLQAKQNYTDVMRYFTGLIRFLIRLGKLRDDDPETMAAQLCLPISVWINLCDREPEREDEIITLIRKHVRQFFDLYKAESKKDEAMYSEYRVKNIIGSNYSGFTTHCRRVSRAVVIKDGKLLLSHEKNIDKWMLPGGGVEGDETHELCCIREVAEETGYVVKPERCFMVINEYYEDWKYASYYFVCTIEGQTERNLTDREREVGAEPEWLDPDMALDIFSHHSDYTENDENRRGVYLREYIALTELKNGDRI